MPQSKMLLLEEQLLKNDQSQEAWEECKEPLQNALPADTRPL